LQHALHLSAFRVDCIFLCLQLHAAAAGKAKCIATVTNTGNWRLKSLTFSSATGADVSGCATDMLAPGASRDCYAEVTLAQADFDSATEASVQKAVHVKVLDDDTNVFYEANSAITLEMLPGLDVTVTSNPATLQPPSGEPRKL
jgi:hypothetical protein